MSEKQEIKTIITAAELHAEQIGNGDYKKANKNYDIIVYNVEELKASGELKLLLPLLEHKSIGVRIAAATFLLGQFEQEALATLKLIAKMSIPLHSFRAEQTISEWESGNLKI